MEQYRKALAIDPHFVPSHFGIAADLTYMGKPEDADAELQKMAEVSRNDGELRTALFGMAVVASDGGKFDKAVQAMDKEYRGCGKKERRGVDGGGPSGQGQYHRRDAEVRSGGAAV